MRASDFPRVADFEPVISVLELLPGRLVDTLLEQTVLVTQTVAPSRKVEGGDGVQKTRRQATQTAVAETGIAFDAHDVFQRVTERAKRLRVLAGETHVTDGVRQRAPLQVLHGKVVRLLRVLLVEVRVRVVPSLHQPFANALSGGLVHFRHAKLNRKRARGLRRVVLHVLLDRLGRLTDVGGDGANRRLVRRSY